MTTGDTTQLEEDVLLKDWYQKRRNTTIIVFLDKCLFAFESSAIGISALYYYQYTIKADDPKFYYSLAMGAMFFAALLTSVFVGRYVDRTRNIRGYMLITIMLAVIGNFMYALPFSKWLPIISRCLCGFADGGIPAIEGEFITLTSEIFTNLQN